MEPEIIAALVGGLFTLVGVFIPLYLRWRKARRTPAAAYTPAEGLSAVVGVVQRGRQVLLVQRRSRLRNLSWQFPAGVVKPGMDLRDKVESEVLAETGVYCRAQRFLGARVQADTRVLCHYVHCLYLEGQARNLDPQENSQVAWVDAATARRYITSDIYVAVDQLLDAIDASAVWPTVALGVVWAQGQVLVVRKKGDDAVFPWRFPGGLVEPSESEADAATREVAEETGIQCLAERKLGERLHPDSQQVVAYWLCRPTGGALKLTEPHHFSAVEWMPPEAVITLFGDRLFTEVKEFLVANPA